MKKYNAFIFDLDGTLIDSMGIWKQLDIDYLAKFQIPMPSNLQQEIEGLSFHDTAIYFKEHFGIPDTIEEILEDWNQMSYDIYCHQVPLKPGAKTILEYARTHHIPCGIATSNTLDLVMGVLKHHNIDSYFDTIITAGDVGKGKPAPDVFLAAAKRLQVSPEECLVFEDIVAGIDGAHNAGMTVVAVKDAYSAYQEDQKIEKADFFIENFEEILAYLENNEM